jgi:hypothetical protein
MRPLTRIALAMLRIASAIRPLPARGERLGRRRINRSHAVSAADFELGDNPAHMTTFMESHALKNVVEDVIGGSQTHCRERQRRIRGGDGGEAAAADQI